jgi:hypothetical protein
MMPLILDIIGCLLSETIHTWIAHEVVIEAADYKGCPYEHPLSVDLLVMLEGSLE